MKNDPLPEWKVYTHEFGSARDLVIAQIFVETLSSTEREALRGIFGMLTNIDSNRIYIRQEREGDLCFTT